MVHLIKKLSGYFGKLEQNPNFNFVTLYLLRATSVLYIPVLDLKLSFTSIIT